MTKIAINKKANYNYLISEKIEAGLILTGQEVKSLRNNTASIKESYIGKKKSELWLINCHISEYKFSSTTNYNPTRMRKILVSKKEQNKIISYVDRERFSIVPISLYFNKKGIVKILLGIGKGKKQYDKRQTLKTKEWNIQKQRLLKNS